MILLIPSVWAQDGSDLIAKLRSRYDTMEALRASFSQTTTSTYLDETEHFYGEILLHGDKYWIESGQQTIVTNTETTWVYNRGENQVLINDYELDETTFSLSTFLAEFDTLYSVEDVIRSGDMDVITLVPVDPLSAFRNVTIWAAVDTVVRIDVVDMNDVEMSVILSDIQFNPEIPDGSFLFSVPEGVEVIDLREN